MFDTEKLRIIRKEKGYTIYDMAKMLNITASYYALLETKKRRMFYEMAYKIAAIFNMKPDNLFYTKNNT